MILANKNVICGYFLSLQFLQTKTLWTEKPQFGIQHFIHKLKPITVSTGQWVTVQVCQISINRLHMAALHHASPRTRHWFIRPLHPPIKVLCSLSFSACVCVCVCVGVDKVKVCMCASVQAQLDHIGPVLVCVFRRHAYTFTNTFKHNQKVFPRYLLDSKQHRRAKYTLGLKKERKNVYRQQSDSCIHTGRKSPPELFIMATLI